MKTKETKVRTPPPFGSNCWCTLTLTHTQKPIRLTFFGGKQTAGQMHHPQQTDTFGGLGMFTRSCRPPRPHPEPRPAQSQEGKAEGERAHHSN